MQNQTLLTIDRQTFEERWKNCGLPCRVMAKADELAALPPVKSDWEKVVGKAREALKKDCSLEVFFGRSGTGKTMAAAMLVREACNRHEESLFTTATDLLLEFRDIAKSRSGGERVALARYQSPRLLVIDDFPMLDADKWESQMVWHLLAKRMDAMRPTIVCTILNDERFQDEARKRLGSRLTNGQGFYLHSDTFNASAK